MAPPEASQVSSSGITTNAATGERYIPSSIRADGSKRREIRVRPGYRPPEDVELYKNRAAQAWKNRGKGGVPGAEGLSSSSGDDKTGTAASNKNAKRREAKKKAKENEALQDANATGKDGAASLDRNWRAGGDNKKTTGEPLDKTTTEEHLQPIDPAVEKDKKARNLKKKLRQARELSEKKNQGEALLPEQLEKIIKINELVRQLDMLGFDANGEEKKPAAADEDGDKV